MVCVSGGGPEGRITKRAPLRLGRLAFRGFDRIYAVYIEQEYEHADAWRSYEIELEARPGELFVNVRPGQWMGAD
jgi:hypothetical protein